MTFRTGHTIKENIVNKFIPFNGTGANDATGTENT
jgi:hypothetical protein